MTYKMSNGCYYKVHGYGNQFHAEFHYAGGERDFMRDLYANGGKYYKTRAAVAKACERQGAGEWEF